MLLLLYRGTHLPPVIRGALTGRPVQIASIRQSAALLTRTNVQTAKR